MKIIEMENTLRLFPDNLTVKDEIPPGTYIVKFSPLSGYSLERQKNFENKIKVYGNHLELRDKMLRRYENSEKNFGVILGGKKGTGKSMLARLVSEKLIEKGIPTIIIKEDSDGITDFINSIEQPVLILMDEFEKIFIKNDEYPEDDTQVKFLNVFDGISNLKHFYMITINDYDKLNNYLKGRTGRFYYDFKFGDISADEIEEYIDDNLTCELDVKKEKLISILNRIKTNYDQLEAIVKELNYGETLRDTLTYLNLGIYDIDLQFINIRAFLSDGDHLDISRRVWIGGIEEIKSHFDLDVSDKTADEYDNFPYVLTIPEDAYVYKRDSIEIDPKKVSLSPVFEEINDDDIELAKKCCPKIKSISMEFESRVNPKVLQI